MNASVAPGQVTWRGPVVRPMGGPPGLGESIAPSFPPYNAREVRPGDSSPLSATTDVFTGILDTGRLAEVRNRAIYDPNSLVWAPVADAATGVLFPDAVAAKTSIESSLRMRPTTFKGPKQLDVGIDNPDEHFNRMIHPLAWRNGGGRENATGSAESGPAESGSARPGSAEPGSAEPGSASASAFAASTSAASTSAASTSAAGTSDAAVAPAGDSWFKWKGDLPFVGFPNPNFFNMYTDAIPTQNLQNITHAQMVDALRAASVGDFDHNLYLDSIGSLLRSSAVPDGPMSQSNDKVIQSDGGGVNADPRLLERIYDEYEVEFNRAKRMRIAEQSTDPRFVEVTPGSSYIEEKDRFLRDQESWFSETQQTTGIATGFSTPNVMLT
jgi:hypothetical protein